MTNEDIKEEMEFIHESIKDLIKLTEDTNLSRFAKLIDEKFDYLKEETNFSLKQYEIMFEQRLH